MGESLELDIAKVEAAKQGDADSFAEVYNSISQDLYRVALYTLGNSYDAEDVVSETFMEAYKGIKNLRDSSKCKAWMMKILSIRCKRKISQYVTDRQNFDIDTILDLSDLTNLSSDVSEQMTLVQALKHLSEQERLIISLAVVQGYTTKEVAQMIGSPHGTVSSKLHRSLAKLRRLMELEK